MQTFKCRKKIYRSPINETGFWPWILALVFSHAIVSKYLSSTINIGKIIIPFIQYNLNRGWGEKT